MFITLILPNQVSRPLKTLIGAGLRGQLDGNTSIDNVLREIISNFVWTETLGISEVAGK